MSYINKALSTPTPQTEPISPKQVKNNAGGYVFSIGPLEQVKRFLILGTEGITTTREQAEAAYDKVQHEKAAQDVDLALTPRPNALH